MKDQLIDLIVQRLNQSKDQLKEEFNCKQPISVARHFKVDNLLPTDIAEQASAEFPEIKKMRTLTNLGELRLKYSHIRDTSRLLQNLHHAIQDPKVVAVVEEITGIKNQIPDHSRIAGGVTALLKNHFINPHLDNSHDIDRKYYRTVNLLYYLSPNWSIENGGNYELWDQSVEQRIIVPSLFNRLLIMETNRYSWHAVNPVTCDSPRRCLFNYYFSEQSPEGEDYFHGSAALFFNPLFRPRPEQKIRRAIGRARDFCFGKAW